MARYHATVESRWPSKDTFDCAEVRLRGPLGLLDPVLRRGFDGAGGRATAGLARALATVPSRPGGS